MHGEYLGLECSYIADNANDMVWVQKLKHVIQNINNEDDYEKLYIIRYMQHLRPRFDTKVVVQSAADRYV